MVTSLDTAKEAVDAGVDGLVVEGIEGAGLKGTAEVASMVLLLLIARHLDVPLVTAGGIADGVSMAAAFALGAEGVQMGTRMLASIESNVHGGLKDAVLRAAETDTVLVNRHNGKPLRVLRTETTAALEFATEGDPMRDLLPNVGLTYTEGSSRTRSRRSARSRAGSTRCSRWPRSCAPRWRNSARWWSGWGRTTSRRPDGQRPQTGFMSASR